MPLGAGGGPLQARCTAGDRAVSARLVTTELQYCQADAAQAQASQLDVSFIAEQQALHEEAWALVREGMEVVTRRHASDTLGVNKCRPDEVQYVMRRLALSMHGGVDTAQRARRLETAASNASCFGVSAAILMARLCLYRLHC